MTKKDVSTPAAGFSRRFGITSQREIRKSRPRRARSAASRANEKLRPR